MAFSFAVNFRRKSAGNGIARFKRVAFEKNGLFTNAQLAPLRRVSAHLAFVYYHHY